MNAIYLQTNVITIYKCLLAIIVWNELEVNLDVWICVCELV